jgi:8-amino-7-oxononanoate synthase
MHYAGREVLAFCANDYLGLAQDETVTQAFLEGVERYGVGAGAAHLISGHSSAHQALEEALADWLGRTRALLFSTGYMANAGIVQALLQPKDLLLQDKLNHASLIDAGLCSAAKVIRYQHADLDSAAQQISAHRSRYEQALLATDGVFSMDGDLAPLPALSQLCSQHDVQLLVDDAHGLGVLGRQGRGTLDHFGLGVTEVPILMGTLGKAFGVFGAFVAGDNALIESLIQDARSYVYTTATPPALAVAAQAALQRVIADDWRRDKLQQLIQRFRHGAHALGLALMPSSTAIQPIVVGAAEEALRWSQALLERDILVTAIRPPTVPQGSARLRVTLSALHEEQDVDRLLDALQQIQMAKVR